MGVYYAALNLTKRERLDLFGVGAHNKSLGPYTLSLEHDSSAARALACLMATRWRGDHVVIIRDIDAEQQELWMEAHEWPSVIPEGWTPAPRDDESDP
jgi:hypothetical protein